jgi:ABC-type polysaccharide/polyol phosphate transport system ATPase subunit
MDTVLRSIGGSGMKRFVLPSGVVLRAEGLGKQYPKPSAPSSLSGHLRGRRLGGTIADEGVGLDASDDDDDDDMDTEVSGREGRPVVPASGWALADLSFELPFGAALAVVGPPGSGKTTLLQILARVTRPTVGRVLLQGPVTPVLAPSVGLVRPGTTVAESVVALGVTFGARPSSMREHLVSTIACAGLESSADAPVSTIPRASVRQLIVSVAVHTYPAVIVAEIGMLAGAPTFTARLQETLSMRRQEGLALVIAGGLRDEKHLHRYCDRSLVLDEGRSTGPITAFR